MGGTPYRNGRFPKIWGYPQNGWFIRDNPNLNPTKMDDDWGLPPAIIHFRLGFSHEINPPAIGYPHWWKSPDVFFWGKMPSTNGWGTWVAIFQEMPHMEMDGSFHGKSYIIIDDYRGPIWGSPALKPPYPGTKDLGFKWFRTSPTTTVNFMGIQLIQSPFRVVTASSNTWLKGESRPSFFWGSIKLGRLEESPW